MADVLSQSQIDELLRSMQSSEPEPDIKPVEQVVDLESVKYRKYDFYSPRKFTKDKMKILQSAFENYARILTSQVNGIFRVMTDITDTCKAPTRHQALCWGLFRHICPDSYLSLS